MEITYSKVGDYLIPDLSLPTAEEKIPISVWSMRHKRHLMQYRKIEFALMLTNGTLQSYLADIDEQAEALFSRLVNDIAKADGVTEQLKDEEQMLWVQQMNNIHNGARELVYSELIYC